MSTIFDCSEVHASNAAKIFNFMTSRYNVTIGEFKKNLREQDFLGMHFTYGVPQTVCLKEAFVQKLILGPPAKEMLFTDYETLIGRLFFAGQVLLFHFADFYYTGY